MQRRSPTRVASSRLLHGEWDTEGIPAFFCLMVQDDEKLLWHTLIYLKILFSYILFGSAASSLGSVASDPSMPERPRKGASLCSQDVLRRFPGPFVRRKEVMAVVVADGASVCFSPTTYHSHSHQLHLSVSHQSTRKVLRNTPVQVGDFDSKARAAHLQLGIKFGFVL